MQDDIFGSNFEICDEDFNSDTHIATVSVPGVSLGLLAGLCESSCQGSRFPIASLSSNAGEVTLELYCPECNPGTSVMEILNPPVEESHSGKRKSRCATLLWGLASSGPLHT